MELIISPKRIALALSGFSLYLCLHSIIGKAIEYAVGANSTYFIYHVVRLFNVNRESNIPTWYTSMMLLVCAVLIAAIARTEKAKSENYIRRWWGLALIFLCLSIDEAAAIHEKLTIPLQESLNLGGYLYFAWVLVGIPLVVVFALTYFTFVLHLPQRTRNLFFLAGLLYIGGALGIELIGANRWYIDDGTSLPYSAIATIEELLEMLGIVVLIYALLSYIASSVESLRIVIIPRSR